MSDGGELLRAVLDQSTITGNIRGYTLEANVLAIPTAQTAVAHYQVDPSCYFLVTNINPYFILDDGETFTGGSANQAPWMGIKFRRSSTSFEYSTDNVLMGLWGGSNIQVSTLEDYWYLPPSETITADFTFNPGFYGNPAIAGVTLMGIEYKP